MFSVKRAVRPVRRLAVTLALAAALAEGGYGQEARSLTVYAGQGRMMRLDQPVASVFVADPAVADVQVASSQVLFVFGKAVGRTSVAALAEDGAAVGRWEVAVTLDIAPVRSALSEDPDLRNVQVRRWRGGVELRGVVASAAAADRALEVAGRGPAREGRGDKPPLRVRPAAGEPRSADRGGAAQRERVAGHQLGSVQLARGGPFRLPRGAPHRGRRLPGGRLHRGAGVHLVRTA